MTSPTPAPVAQPLRGAVWPAPGPWPDADCAAWMPGPWDHDASAADRTFAATVCNGCPVRAACEGYAVRHGPVGTWGGRFYRLGPAGRSEAA